MLLQEVLTVTQVQVAHMFMLMMGRCLNQSEHTCFKLNNLKTHQSAPGGCRRICVFYREEMINIAGGVITGSSWWRVIDGGESPHRST